MKTHLSECLFPFTNLEHHFMTLFSKYDKQNPDISSPDTTSMMS